MRRPRRPGAADDAAVIESSWREPERFAVLFDRHAPYIHRYLARQYRIGQAASTAEPAVPGHADRVAADVTAQAMRPLLDAALAALSAGDRDVLLLIAFEQLAYQEVARALAIPVGTVQSRLHRARTKVRQVLAGTDAGATYEELTTNE
jgi:RNA polymerase sigma-70 factor (ECF subfamily)